MIICERTKGLILLKMDQRELNKDLLLDWWNQNDAEDNFANAYEQDALLKMIKKRHRILDHFAYMHGETEFVPCDDQWICHLSHFYAKSKEPMLRSWLKNDLKIINNEMLEDEMVELIEGHVFDISSLSLTEYVENYVVTKNQTGGGRLSRDAMIGKWREFRAAQTREELLEPRMNGTATLSYDGEGLEKQFETILHPKDGDGGTVQSSPSSGSRVTASPSTDTDTTLSTQLDPSANSSIMYQSSSISVAPNPTSPPINISVASDRISFTRHESLSDPLTMYMIYALTAIILARIGLRACTCCLVGCCISSSGTNTDTQVYERLRTDDIDGGDVVESEDRETTGSSCLISAVFSF